MSWRVAILPMLDYDLLYRQYDPKQPWDRHKNLGIVKGMPPEFRCPSDGDAGEGETSYVMITGNNTIGGPLGSPGTRSAEVMDGLSRTILVIEVHGLKIPWMEPRDITLDELLARVQSGTRIGHVASFNVAMGDDSVQKLPAKIDAETCAAWPLSTTDCPCKSLSFEHCRFPLTSTRSSKATARLALPSRSKNAFAGPRLRPGVRHSRRLLLTAS